MICDRGSRVLSQHIRAVVQTWHCCLAPSPRANCFKAAAAACSSGAVTATYWATHRHMQAQLWHGYLVS
jgi:hypothetical protein